MFIGLEKDLQEDHADVSLEMFLSRFPTPSFSEQAQRFVRQGHAYCTKVTASIGVYCNFKHGSNF